MRLARWIVAGMLFTAVCRGAAPAVQPVAAGTKPGAPPRGTPVGYTVHFDFLDSMADAERLVRFAIGSGATILNVVPPAHIWESPESVVILHRIFALARDAGVGVVLNRIDASLPAPPGQRRVNWLYQNVLTERGRLPDGRPTPDFFLATVGKHDYERWLREETSYYAQNFSTERNLLGFSLGPFNEPFVSQRGSLLCFDPTTNSYEIGQYTPYAAAWYHAFLERQYCNPAAMNRPYDFLKWQYCDPAAMNQRYGTAFATFEAVPLPRNETDQTFGNPAAAYWDFVASINDWVVRQLDACRVLWDARSRPGVPFVLQFSGFLPEKFEKGRPAFAALDIFDWMIRADALGLSLYTNCEYPDWGHASDRAMANFLRLGGLLGKKVFVLEGGNECGGALLDRRELRFFADTARSLAPASVIYEFLKDTFYECGARRDGKILSDSWAVRRRTLAAVRKALELARQPLAAESPAWVLDEPELIADQPDRLELRKALVHVAMERPIAFVPSMIVRVLDGLPAGSTLFVLRPIDCDMLVGTLASKPIDVRMADELVKAGSDAAGEGAERGDSPARHRR